MKTTELTVSDVARMALTMEEKGQNFYSWAAGEFKDNEVADMFKRLAEEEKEHARIFKKLLDLPDAGELVSQESNRYLRMLANSGLFPSSGEVNDEHIKTPSDVLNIGIQAEKDAILFYQEMYNLAHSIEVKQTLSKLLEEEKMHLVELRDSMEELRVIQV